MVVFFFKTAKPEAEGRLKSLSDLAVAREGKENLVQRNSHPNFETFNCIMSTLGSEIKALARLLISSLFSRGHGPYSRPKA